MIQSYKICADSEYLHCFVKSDHSATQAGPTYARNDTTAQNRAKAGGLVCWFEPLLSKLLSVHIRVFLSLNVEEKLPKRLVLKHFSHV